MGVDPGLENTGVAVIQTRQVGCFLLYVGFVRTKSERSNDLRMMDIERELRRVRTIYNPELYGVEEQAGAIIGATKKGKTGAQSLQSLIVVGITCSEAAHGRATWRQVTPQQIRTQVLGGGNQAADKAAIRRAVKDERRFDQSKLKSNKAIRWSEHKADACAVAWTAAAQERVTRYIARRAS